MSQDTPVKTIPAGDGTSASHPAPDLSQASERTLRDIVQLYRHLDLAGVPSLRAVMRELERRHEGRGPAAGGTTGPRWQDIPIGARVRPKRGRRQGTVVRFIEPTRGDGVSMHVAVRWDRTPQWSEAWATDCLVVLEVPVAAPVAEVA